MENLNLYKSRGYSIRKRMQQCECKIRFRALQEPGKVREVSLKLKPYSLYYKLAPVYH